MNFNLPLTRRDVVVLFIYAVLAHNVLSSFFYLLCRIILPDIPWLQSSIAGPPVEYAAVNLATNIVLTLGFLPFVSLIAKAVTGRSASENVTPKHTTSLVFQCLGMMLFVMSMSTLVRGIVDMKRLMVTSASLSSTVLPFTIDGLASSAFGVFVGLVIALSPSLFARRTAAKRGEESAA